MMWMIAAMSAWACDEVSPVPSSLQVAWISPLSRTARSGTALEVVRVQDLRSWIRSNSSDMDRVLQALGMIDRGASASTEYKITIFDVQGESLCRPISAADPGEDVSGVGSTIRFEELKVAILQALLNP